MSDQREGHDAWGEEEDEWDDEETAAVSFHTGEFEIKEDAGPLFMVMSGSCQGDRLFVEDGLIIGRGRGSTVRIADEGISRVHFQITSQADGSYAIIDMGSRNGTQINGQRMQSAVLQDGDTILIGHGTLLRFWSSESKMEEPLDPADRRVHERVKLVVKIDYPTVEHFLEDYSINISQGGMRICTSQPMAVGDSLEMQLSLPGLLQATSVRGIVRWVRNDESGELMAGIRIEHQDDESRDALADLVNRVTASRETKHCARTVRLLIADDNPVVVKLVRDGLQQQLGRGKDPIDVQITHASDGEQALQLLESGSYHMMIVEAALPGIKGEALIRTIRSDPAHAELLIVAVSRKGEETRQLLREAGADFFISKPLRLVDLLQTVRGLLPDAQPD